MLKDKKIGFIGGGNMATAIIKGVIDSGKLSSKDIYVFRADPNKLKNMQEELNINAVKNNVELAKTCDILVLAVKPYMCASVLEEIKSSLTPNQILVSVAAGWSTEKLRNAIDKKAKVLRTMMNTAAMVGEAVITFSKDNDLDETELANLTDLFSANGLVLNLEEEKMYATAGISDTLPACVAMYIEALADGGVMNGLPREFALKVAAQAVMGSAKLVLETNKHPGIIKDQVCTPGGITIEAVASLEEDAFRGTVIRACNRCTQKSLSMLKQQQ